jgi:hypothetical protein
MFSPTLTALDNLQISTALGSVAVVQTDSSSIADLVRKADTHPRRMPALIETGRSKAMNTAELDGS